VVTMPRATLTVNDIIVATERDVQNKLYGRTGAGNSPLLVDYVDRVHLEVCRSRLWDFLRSAPQRFITEKEQPDYWIGATGTGPNNAVETGLNITDIDFIDPHSVIDGSNYLQLYNVHDDFNAPTDVQRDRQPRIGRPLYWRWTDDNPNILSLSPAPDETCDYMPAPPAPLVTTVPGGTLPARTYFVITSFVDSTDGESVASREARIFVPANNLAVVHSPVPYISKSSAGVQYNRYNVYAATTSGNETLQTTVPVAVGTNWTEPATGLVVGMRSYPTGSTLEPLRGYVIQFRYYKRINRLTATTSALQVPDDYRDVLVAGTNRLAFRYLLDSQGPAYQAKADYWTQEFERLKLWMARQERVRSYVPSFIRPDPSRSIYRSWPSRETVVWR